MSDHLAIDIGASGGKVFIARFTDEDFGLLEFGIIDNSPVMKDGRPVWDIDHIVGELFDLLDRIPENISSIGIDTWGVDFGLLGADGLLLQHPYSYRDPNVSTSVKRALSIVSKKELFQRTGIQHLPFNTIFQICSLQMNDRKVLNQTGCILPIPSLLTRFLNGESSCEATIASTTQMVDIETGDWAEDILQKLDIPIDILPPIRKTGYIAGETTSGIPLVHTASHDTASAVAAFDLEQNDMYISTGSWFLAGMVLSHPLISDEAFDAGLSNERAADGRFRVLKNVTGLYLFEELIRDWKMEGTEEEINRLVDAASEADSFGPLFDPDDPSLATPGGMESKIYKLLKNSMQEFPSGKGGLVRSVFESITLKCALVLETIANISEIKPARLHIGGGGARNKLLVSMLAGATGLPCIAGPADATAIGNAIVQAHAMGSIPSIDAGAKLVARSMELEVIKPENLDRWKDAKEQYAEQIYNRG